MHIALCVHTGLFMKDNASEIYRELSLAVEKQREPRVAFPQASVRYQTSSLFFLKGRLQYIFLVINGFRISYIITCMHLHTSGKDWVLAHAICHYKCSDSFTVYIWMSGLGIQATIMRKYSGDRNEIYRLLWEKSVLCLCKSEYGFCSRLD